MAISLAKVADIDRNLGDEDTAVEGFQEGIKLLQSLELKPEEVSLEQRVILIYLLCYFILHWCIFVILQT